MIVTLETIDRRAFVARGAAIVSAVALEPHARWFRYAPFTVRIGLASSLTRDQRLGLELGLDEARHAATMFGGTVVDVPIASPSGNTEAISAVIGGGDEASALAWTRYAVKSSTIYMNVGCTSDRLRKEDCSRAAFHVAPSDAMAQDAVRAARSPANERAEAWDASLARFGADTLNQRFLTRFHSPMSPGAWAAWFAVKAVWESALRQKSGESVRIAEYLASDATQFDGHKGAPLSFRSWDHQLRQPLYIVSGGQPKQVPEITGDDSIREVLDRLGGSTRSSSCGTGHE